MVEWYRRRVHHMVVPVPVIFTIVVSLTAVVLLLRSRSPPSSTLFLAPRHPSLSGTWKRKLLNLFSYLILHTLISTRALAYTVEIVIMHRMIMHKSHIAWVFLGTKLSKHGIVP
jgi:hypothetical protein